MKKQYFLFAIITLIMGRSFGQAPSGSPVTFEPGQPGATWTFTSFENGGGIGFEKVANPAVTGINTSATVAKFTALQAGQPYAGCESMHGTDLGTFTLNATNCTVKIMVWKPVISDVGIKFATASGGSSGEIKVPNTKINEWEELTFNFAGKIGEGVSTGIDQIIVFPDFQARVTDNICYFDNISFSAQISGPADPAPVVAAPTPVVPAADVISLFSNAYTNVPVDTWSAGWDAADVADIQIAGNDTKKYTNLNYSGIEFTTNPINAAIMDHYHVDIWTPNSTTFHIKLVDFGANGTFGGGDDTESELTYTPTLSGWVSYDIPFSDFTSLASRAHLAQMLFIGSNSTVFVDNVYLYKSSVVAVTPHAPVTFETGEPGSAWTFTSFENGGGIGFEKVTNPSATGINTSATVAKFTALQAGQPYAGCESMHGSDLGTFTLNATNSTVKIMVWKPVISDVGIKFATASGGSTGEIKVANTKINEWEELTFNFAGKIGEASSTDIDQIVIFPDFQARAADNVCYFDNISFSAKITPPPVDEPLVAAPTPTLAAANVISLFSNAYTNVPVDTWSAGWDAADVADVLVAGNDTKKYTNLNYSGIEFTSAPVNATAMNFYHVDIWTPNSTTFHVKLVDFGANGIFGGGDDTESELTFTPALKGWVSYDIPLSDFTGLASRAHLAQMLFIGSNSIVYVDNVYFATSSTTPVGLTEFKAVKNGNAITLNWKTASEINSKGFYVERSKDGINWVNLQFVYSNATAIAGSRYSSVDNSPVKGINYYRLNQIDIDGKQTYSSTLSVRFTSPGNKGFSFYPNPAKDRLTVLLEAIESNTASIELISTAGKIVKRFSLDKSYSNSNVSMDIRNISKGTYFLVVKDGVNITSSPLLVD